MSFPFLLLFRFVTDIPTLSEATIVPYTPPSSLGNYTDESEPGHVYGNTNKTNKLTTKRVGSYEDSSSISSVS